MPPTKAGAHPVQERLKRIARNLVLFDYDELQNYPSDLRDKVQHTAKELEAIGAHIAAIDATEKADEASQEARHESAEVSADTRAHKGKAKG